MHKYVKNMLKKTNSFYNAAMSTIVMIQGITILYGSESHSFSKVSDRSLMKYVCVVYKRLNEC